MLIIRRDTLHIGFLKDTVEHNRDNIIKRINHFDAVAKNEAAVMKSGGTDIDAVLERLLGR